MQDKASILAADARLQAFATHRARLAVFFGVSVTLILTLAVLGAAFYLTSEDGTRTLDTDFRVFWATARIFLAGEPLAAFDVTRLDAEYNQVADGWMPWLYPPGYLFVIAPLGTLSYSVAFLLMTLISVAAIASAARPFVAGVTPVWVAMSLAPAYLPALLIGQNSLIWLSGLLLALAALRDGRFLLAGVVIGCLTLKPQLGLMIPFALLAAGLWRTMFAAAGTAIALAALPTLVVGLDYWPLLATRMQEQATGLYSLITELSLTVGPFFLGTMLGLPPSVALVVQWAVSAFTAVSVVLFWRSRRVGFDAKVALLLIAILLSAPYLWYYEAAMMAAIGLFLWRAGILTTRATHLCLLVLLWIGAGLQSAAILLQFPAERYLGAVIVTPVLFLCLALCWRHLLAARRADVPTG